MNTKIPFEKFRVLATADPFAVFQVSVQPALWSRQAPGDDLIHFVLLDWLGRDGQIDWSHGTFLVELAEELST